MPKSKKSRSAGAKVPVYLRHRSGGRDRAMCYVWDGEKRRRVYLGAWDSPESKRRFRELIRSQLIADSRPNRGVGAAEFSSVTVEDLVARFLAWGEVHYRKHGKLTNSWSGMKAAAAPLLDLHRDESVAEFGPKKLKLVQAELVARGYARQTVNSSVRKIRTIFKWGVAEELVPSWILEGLRAVSAVQRGRTTAREAKPIEPVPLPDLRASLKKMVPSLQAMVKVQLLTGMRPGELVQLRMADIDRDGPDRCWVFTPQSHKNEHSGLSRHVVLSPSAQRVLRPFIRLDPQAWIFAPSIAVEERRQMLRSRRKSKVPPSQLDRDRRRRENPGRDYRDRWNTTNYRRAIHYACDAAGVARWSPNQLRHSFENVAEQVCGLEATSKALGHAQLGTTEHYRSRLNLEQATRAMKAVESQQHRLGIR